MTRALSTQASPCPKQLGQEVDHYWLVQRMAKTAHVDLAWAFDEGLLSQEEWAGMVQRCRGCAWAEGCKDWLAIPGQDTDIPPEGCLNRGRMDALKRACAMVDAASAA
ncbi:DUF6455 family protein [Tropicimonas sp. S265A]|uniref:DUF6455 family protein n=1 Tax=Tropicimonas sp. S265A TaxID=3415134 RepID=UPI003C7D1AC2